MTAALDNVARRLTALLNLANGAIGTPEGENARRKAAHYASKHAIDIDAFKPNEPTNTRPIGNHYKPGSRAQWRVALASAVSRYAGVSMVIHTGGEPSWTLVGVASDFATWRTLYERAADEIDAEGARYVRSLDTDATYRCRECYHKTTAEGVECPECFGGEMRKLATPSKRSEGDTFRKSAAQGFGARLASHKAEAEASANGRVTADLLKRAGNDATQSTAMVLVGRALAVKAEEKRLFPKLRTTRGAGMSGSSGARGAGFAFGRGMGVHKGSLGGGK